MSNSSPATSKRRKLLEHPLSVSASQLKLLHQATSLHFGYCNNDKNKPHGNWKCNGSTTLYVTLPDAPEQQKSVQELAFHLRSSVAVDSVEVEGITSSSSTRPLETLQPEPLLVHAYHHVDPLHHVLVAPVIVEDKPKEHYTEMRKENYKFDADAQSIRGAAGMTTGLRAAGIASNIGELRILVADTGTAIPDERSIVAWRDDLEHTTAASTGSSMTSRMQQRLNARVMERRTRRLDYVACQLAATTRSYKVTIHYHLPFQQPHQHHWGGIHAFLGPTPHVYTTAGVHGDPEGPRTWLPCLDSAAVSHRGTHTLNIMVTAPVTLGLSILGCGEDFGVTETILHHGGTSDANSVQEEVGMVHYKAIILAIQQTLKTSEIVTLESILATTLWCSHIWTPVPCRSLGFAIGPFKVLEDPEYFGPSALDNKDENGDDDDEDDERVSFDDRLDEFLENARAQGEGMRQVYFAPLFERKHIYTAFGSIARTHLLQNSTLRLLPMTSEQRKLASELDQTVTFATSGVPHRALSLMRDVLAVPIYRTASYTQIWIPQAVHGGCTSGALHCCPEVLVNPFLGGAIMDSRLLPPVGSRLPYYQGGRVLQFLQARCAVRGWITAALPLGGNDDVGSGYLFALIESFLMSLYERGHGGHGEGGASGSIFYSKRYSTMCGLNSSNLDFLPVQNVEETDVVIEGVGAVPVEDRHNEQLWRGANNGSESHTSAMDEFNTRQMLCKDAVEALERGTDKDKTVPSPSMGWFGSYLSLTFLSSNATSSSDLGCGVVELLHPVGGLVYRALKSELFRGVVEGRAGVANFIRLVRAAFIAAHLDDIGETELKLPKSRKRTDKLTSSVDEKGAGDTPEENLSQPKQPFVVCVNEILKKKGLTHTLFTRALQNLSGRTKEAQLLGTLVDVDPMATDPRTQLPFVDPEGFPNSFVRGASLLYCRVGVQVEVTRDANVTKGIQMQAYAEPIIPEGGIAYGGPITIRVVENEGSFREYVKDLAADGSRRDWGAMFLHAKPVTKKETQTAASGTIEGRASDATKSPTAKVSSPAQPNFFAESDFLTGGYQAIELVRLSNLTPLLWVRVDPMGLYGGRISVFQPDACLAEQLFHDGDAGAQIDALRALAERPLRIQGSGKVKTLYDVNVSELPVRLLGDCLRGSPALHSSLPHTPAVRAQAALTISQWQNNKAPNSKNAVGADVWVGMNILAQYFRERFYSNNTVMPTKFMRLVLKKSDAESQTNTAITDVSAPNPQPSYDESYVYLDSIDDNERGDALKEAESVEVEEDEEYRVRSSVVTAIACIRAQDGLTPPTAIRLLEKVLDSEDAEMLTNLVYANEECLFEEIFKTVQARSMVATDPDEKMNGNRDKPPIAFVSSMLIADTLLAVCHVNGIPDFITDPTTGQAIQSSVTHPLSHLMESARSWLEWELFREAIRLESAEQIQTGISGICYDVVAACAITALSNLVILIQSTTDSSTGSHQSNRIAEDASSKFYADIFDSDPPRNDLTRASAAQAYCCICCAADRFETPDKQPLGLLTSLEFLLRGINDDATSIGLRHTLALIMMDVCTGKVCSMQRVGTIAGRNDLLWSVARFHNGPLGACHGGDNGSAVLMAVAAKSFPAAAAVNDGARRGMRLLSRAGHPSKEASGVSAAVVVRVARFGTELWRTINGERPTVSDDLSNVLPSAGVCAFDGILRCSLLALWQWIWPKGCVAILKVQSWHSLEKTQQYIDLGANHVMEISDKEKAAATAEENSLADIVRLVDAERDRQFWRGEMARKAYELSKVSRGSTVKDVAATEQGIGQPLPPIARDTAFKQGGWIASAAQQRRAMKLDGGSVVTKVRIKVKKDD